MKKKKVVIRTWSSAGMLFLLLLIGATVRVVAEPPQDKPPFKSEELEQMLAPIALYPDALLSQVLMASTYPLDVVKADRWVKQNPGVTGNALTKTLEAQSWDVSVKSLVNFPQVLSMMSNNLDVTAKIGDAFIGQQKQVMDTIQKLRSLAYKSGNLKTTSQQKIVVEQQAIVIEPVNPAVVYIPTYSPVVYYSTWPYPAYPPPAYYPPGYVPGRALAFTAGVAIGSAWGYAWGHTDWHNGNVNVNVNRNANINSNINRSRYSAEYQKNNPAFKNGGSFQHNAAGAGARPGAGAGAAGVGARPGAGAGAAGVGARPGAGAGAAGAGARHGAQPASKQNAFEGMDRGGSAARAESQRGQTSRSSFSGGGGARGGGGAHGGARGGGGGARGGGSRGGRR